MVSVDALKLIHFSDQNPLGYAVASVEHWDEAKRQGIFEFLAPPGPLERPVEMPIISFNMASLAYREPFLWFFSRRYVRRVKYVGYTNGRHRARYLHYAGATEIPVMCHKDQVAALLEHCTVTRRPDEAIAPD